MKKSLGEGREKGKVVENSKGNSMGNKKIAGAWKFHDFVLSPTLKLGVSTSPFFPPMALTRFMKYPTSKMMVANMVGHDECVDLSNLIVLQRGILKVWLET